MFSNGAHRETQFTGPLPQFLDTRRTVVHPWQQLGPAAPKDFRRRRRAFRWVLDGRDCIGDPCNLLATNNRS
jgi:hypothetical protein